MFFKKFFQMFQSNENSNNRNGSSNYNYQLEAFRRAFVNKLGKSPKEYIRNKINVGSEVNDVRYLFNIVANKIAKDNNCKLFDFDYFYKGF